MAVTLIPQSVLSIIKRAAITVHYMKEEVWSAVSSASPAAKTRNMNLYGVPASGRMGIRKR